MFAAYVSDENKLFKAQRLYPFIGYYLEIINTNDAGSADYGLAVAVRKFAQEYGYTGVQALVGKVTKKAGISSIERRRPLPMR